MTNLEQAGMILHALKNLLRERQAVHGRGGYPTDSDWLTIDRAIAATGFKLDEPATSGLSAPAARPEIIHLSDVWVHHVWFGLTGGTHVLPHGEGSCNGHAQTRTRRRARRQP